MKAIICEMCGSNDLIKQDGVYICQNCGTKYSIEEAKKLLVDVSGTVKIDSSDELNNLYEIARRAKNDNNSENAYKYYEQILVKDPSSWEANFYTTFYQAMNCKIGEIALASIRLSSCEKTVFNLVKNNIPNLDERKVAVSEIGEGLVNISHMFFNAYKNYYDDLAGSLQADDCRAYEDSCTAVRDIVYNAGDWIVELFGDDYGGIAANCWKAGVIQHNIYLSDAYFLGTKRDAEIIKDYSDKILKYDLSYTPPQINMGDNDQMLNASDEHKNTSNGGCYVATAVYGSYDCPEVWVLRRFRDYSLAQTWYGRIFIKIYYAISPLLVKWVGGKAWFMDLFRPMIDKMVTRLKSKGFVDSPYNDKNW